MGPESVVLSLGSRGAVGAFGTDWWRRCRRAVDAVCPIGAGDALTAALYLGHGPQERTPWKPCAGASPRALPRRACPGMRFATLEQTKEIYGQVEVRRAE